MTYEKAIEMLKDLKLGAATRGYKQTAGMCEMAIEALEMRIPKKPYLEYGGWHCKSCGLNVLSDEYFCPVCGQAIDWR